MRTRNFTLWDSGRQELGREHSGGKGERSSQEEMTVFRKNHGGEGGIRTHGPLARSTVFETAPFDHSGTSP